MDNAKLKTALHSLLGLGVYVTTAAVLLIAASFWWMSSEFQKPLPLSEAALVEVERGNGLQSIATILEAQNIIDNPLVFIGGVRILGWQAGLQAGEYEVPPNASMRDIARAMKEGKIYRRVVTIPEGRTSFEIVRTLKAHPQLTGDISFTPPEGSLLPNTYNIKKGETREDLLVRMARAMSDTLDEAWENRAPNLPITTKREALILASIIEKETGKADERRAVAGVFINRLRKSMPLQTDPTVIYAITKGAHKNEGKGPLGRRLLRKDLKFPSPYNTYLNAGLTPGPIANPGKASIEAALNPEAHEYIYFVADGTGGHIFAKTLKEHNANAANWRKIRDAK